MVCAAVLQSRQRRRHREGTAQEILDRTDGKLDAFVASVGTGGTLFGVAQALKEHDPEIAVWGVEPAGTPMVGDPGAYPIIPGVSDGIIPDILESGLIDGVLSINDEEAIGMAHRLAETEGIFCGISAGANVEASLRLAGESGRASASSPSCRTVATAICSLKNTRRRRPVGPAPAPHAVTVVRNPG